MKEANPDPVLERNAAKWAFRASWKQTVLELAALFISGMIMTLAFPGINWSLVAWVGVIPLLFLTCGKTGKRAFAYGFVWGYAWNLTSCFFLREISPAIPFAFAAVLGVFTAVWAWLVPFFCRNLLYPKAILLADFETRRKFYESNAGMEILTALALACWWVGLEWVRSWIFTGFPWNLLSTALWQNLTLIQICEFTGTYGVSFLLIFTNISAFFAIRGLARSLPEGKYKRPYPLIVAMIVVMLATAVGTHTYSWRKDEYAGYNQKMVGFGLVQPNLSQRRAASMNQAEEALEVCLKLTKDLLEKDRDDRARAIEVRRDTPDSGGVKKTSSGNEREYLEAMTPLSLIIWPESAVPVAYRGGSDFSLKYRLALKTLMDSAKIPFLIGTLDFSLTGQKDELGYPRFNLHNSALLLEPGKPLGAEIRDSYSKVHLVPFGEFVPLGDRFPKFNEWIGMGRNLTPGSRFNPLEIAPDVRAGISICYEDVFAYVSRAHNLAGANLLLVITNDAWYPTSYEPEQHYANSVFRAIETRLPLLRCGNSNYSVLVSPSGQLLNTMDKQFDEAKETYRYFPGLQNRTSGKFVVPVPYRHRTTFYTRYGNVFVGVCWSVFLLIGVLALFRWRDYKKALSAPFEEETPPEMNSDR